MKIIRSFFVGLLIASVLLGAPLAQAQSNDSENRMVQVINRSSSTIFHLYVSNKDNTGWGPDQLGIFGIISPGYYRNFNMDDGTGHCIFDIKAVLQNGREAVSRLNVCTTNSWAVTD